MTEVARPGGRFRIPRDLHPVAWWCWAIGLAAGASCTTNPLVLGLLLAVACVVVLACRGDQPWARSFRLYLWLGALVLVVRIVFRVLVGGNDAGHVLVALPEIPLPSWAAGISLLGPFSREELLAGVYEGLRLSSLLIAVGAANALANPKRLMKSLPPALYEIGTAMVVAITVLPQLADSARRVRAAQQLRGGEHGRVRGLRRLLVPILEDAFERSLALAAGMDARGYGRAGAVTPGQRRSTGALMILGLLGICVGVYAFLDASAPRLLAGPMLGLGSASALAGFVVAGRRVRRTRYRPDPWCAPEVLVALSGVAVGAALWTVQRWDPLVAHPGVLGAPPLTVAAAAAVLVGVLPVWAAPPPLTMANRGLAAPPVAAEEPEAVGGVVIELREVTFRYDDRPVLDRVGLTIGAGELVLLAGPTGVGKSTLLGVIAGLVPSFTGGTLTGDVLVDGESVIEVAARDRADVVGYVGQNPPAWFVTDTVEEELAFGMEQLGLQPRTMRRRVEETLDLLGIADLRHRDLRTLSGGQQQRVAIGSVLTSHPRLLVLDEPTSALDPTAAEDVLATITRLVHDVGVSVLVAEHRLERVVPFADRMCLLTGDGQVRVGDPAILLADAPIAPPIVELGRLAGWAPLPLTVRDARRRAGDLRARLGPAPGGASAGRGSRPAVEVRRLVLAHGKVPALREVDLTLPPGTVTALMGRNGAGKSTLLWALQGRLGAAGGSVRVAGEDGALVDPHPLKPDQRRQRVGMVPQSPADLLYLETVADECAAADRSARAAAGSCAGLLEQLAPGIDPATHPRDLSEGQRLALAVAIVLTAGPPVLLLDEPTRGLDYPGKHALAGILRGLAAEGRAVLVATHDVEFAAQVADDVVVLAEGEVVSSGPVRQVIAESPAFAPQVTKVLGPDWLRVDEVAAALDAAPSGAEP